MYAHSYCYTIEERLLRYLAIIKALVIKQSVLFGSSGNSSGWIIIDSKLFLGYSDSRLYYNGIRYIQTSSEQ